MKAEDRLVVRNELAELERLSEFLTAFGDKHEVPPDTGFELNLALEEIFSNVVRHGYVDGDVHEIAVGVAIEDGVFSMRVEDDGIAFNPLDAPPPVLEGPIEDRPIGGLGVHMVRNMMDQIEYRRENGRNILLMKKRVENES